MIRGGRQATGLFLALLALMAQLTMAAVVPASTVSLADLTVLCQHGGDADGPVAPPHQAPDCPICFVCHDLAGPLALLVAQVVLPAPMAIPVARRGHRPPATAPPPRFVRDGFPRAPPTPA